MRPGQQAAQPFAQLRLRRHKPRQHRTGTVDQVCRQLSPALALGRARLPGRALNGMRSRHRLRIPARSHLSARSPAPSPDAEPPRIQALHRARERLVAERTALINQLRALLLERGIVLPQRRRAVAAWSMNP